jgi:hypothetical protein
VAKTALVSPTKPKKKPTDKSPEKRKPSKRAMKRPAPPEVIFDFNWDTEPDPSHADVMAIMKTRGWAIYGRKRRQTYNGLCANRSIASYSCLGHGGVRFAHRVSLERARQFAAPCAAGRPATVHSRRVAKSWILDFPNEEGSPPCGLLAAIQGRTPEK